MYHACTSHEPGLHLPIPSQAHGLYLPRTSHEPGFGPLFPAFLFSVFYFLLCLGGGFGVALGCLVSLDVGCSLFDVGCSGPSGWGVILHPSSIILYPLSFILLPSPPSARPIFPGCVIFTLPPPFRYMFDRCRIGVG